MKDHLNQKTGKVFPRGLRPTPRHRLLAAEPFRAKASPPDECWIFPLTMSMWLNDTYGDCVTAEEAFNKACSAILIEDSTVMTWAEANGVLNGADLEPVIQQMQAAGFAQDSNVYGDGAPLAVNYADAPTLQAAVYQAAQQGGCVKIGIAADQLPAGAGNQNGWFLPSDSPDSNEDHCVGICGYGTVAQFCTAMNAAFGLSLTPPSGVDPTTQGYAIYTWSTIGWASTQAMVNMTGEAWLRSPSSVNTGSGTPTPDKDWTSIPTPPPTPPTPPVPPVPPTPPTPPVPPVPPNPPTPPISIIVPQAGTYVLAPCAGQIAAPVWVMIMESAIESMLADPNLTPFETIALTGLLTFLNAMYPPTADRLRSRIMARLVKGKG